MHAFNSTSLSVFICCYSASITLIEINKSFLADEMLEAESRGVVGRVQDLERRVLEQGDELVCLKATLAEALRRLTIVEGMRLPHNLNQPLSTPNTPIRNGVSKEQLRLRQPAFNSAK